jgi:glycosyltransferase involved in cell wall biosynthesis
MLKWVPTYCKSRTAIIPNGVNLTKFKSIDQNIARQHLKLNDKGKYILFLGDIEDENKNFRLLEMAVLELNKLNVEFKLLTPYPIDSALIPFYLAATDVLAFPSKLEGSPNVIKEALAMGCPIVSTDVGDVRERFADIQGCFLSNFTKDDFARQLMEALRYNRRTKATARLAEIDEKTVANKILKLYDNLLQKD